MKKHWKELLLCGIAVFILIPLVVAYMLSFRFIITDTTNEWIGFWGGYLGSILGGIITLFVLWKTIRTEKEISDREEKIGYFNNLTCIWSELAQHIYDTCMHADRLINENNKEASIRNNYLENMCTGANKATALCIQLEILLETRKEIYNVKEALNMVIELKGKIEKIFDSFDKLKEKGYSIEGKADFLEEISNLDSYIQVVSKKVKDMVYANLYS